MNSNDDETRSPQETQPDPSAKQKENHFSSQDQPTEEEAPSPTPVPEVEWRASEYIHHEKGVLWFVVLAGITTAGVIATVFFGQWTFAVLIIVMGAAVGFFANRPPREVRYQISPSGVAVDQRTFPFSQFRAFGVLNEGAFYSVQLRPAKRFMPGVSIIFAEEDGEKIFDALAARLPAEETHQSQVDKLMRRLRF